MPAANPLQIYLVRHGETLATRERRYEGRGDSDLTRAGLSQARRIVGDLAGSGIRAVYASPSRRALRTAQILATEFGLVPVTLEGLAEVDFGEWDGLTYEEISRRDPDRLERWLADPVQSGPPGGESLVEMWRRVRRCMEEIALTQAPRPAGMEGRGAVAVVSHGGPIQAVLSYCERGDLSAFWNMSIQPGEVRSVAADRLILLRDRGKPEGTGNG